MKYLKHILGFMVVMGLSIQLAYAADLGSAKAGGLIGEQPDGYLGVVVGSAPADVKALVKDVNAKRKQKYGEVAKKQGIPVAEVEKVAGKKVIEKTKSGHFIKVQGSWVKKP